MSFKDLKKNKANALAGLQKKVQESAESTGGGSKDPRKWKFSFDKTTKVGSATIRFLPYGSGERLPWVEWFEFSFKTAAGNYWNRSLKSIGKDDPVAEFNALQWNRNQPGDQDDVKKRKRKTRYIANIIVIDDPATPANNGKVFLFEFGPAIHEIIMKSMVPEYDDEAPVNVFDFWEGANFKLRSKEKNSYLNYDDSKFDKQQALSNDDDILEKIYNAMHPLEEFEKQEGNYKTYEELEKEMIKVLGARYVAGVRGEEFSPQAAAESGGNIFAKEEDNLNAGLAGATTTDEKPQSGGFDVNAGNTEPEKTNTGGFDINAAVADDSKSEDAFANLTQEPGEKEDVFSNLNLDI